MHFPFVFLFAGETMTVPDIYGLGNSLSQLNAVSPSHHSASINNSFGSIGGITPNSSLGATTPHQINANMQTIPFSQLTPTSMSSGSFGTPAKNFDSLQVNSLHKIPIISSTQHHTFEWCVECGQALGRVVPFTVPLAVLMISNGLLVSSQCEMGEKNNIFSSNLNVHLLSPLCFFTIFLVPFQLPSMSHSYQYNSFSLHVRGVCHVYLLCAWVFVYGARCN